MESKVLLIYGEGGHAEQMLRLKSLIDLPFNRDKVKFYGVTDNRKRTKVECCRTYSVWPMRLKERKNIAFSFVYSVFVFLYNFVSSLIILFQVKPKVIISTGPLLFVFFFILSKPFKIKLIYIETWSRFYSSSISGRVAYYLADVFYIQNKELQRLYPKSIFSGRL